MLKIILMPLIPLKIFINIKLSKNTNLSLIKIKKKSHYLYLTVMAHNL